MGTEFWAIIGVGATLLGVILAMWRDNRTAHREIGKKIEKETGKVEVNLKEETGKVDAKVEKVDRKVDEINIFLRNRYAAEAARRGRPSETRQG